VLTGKPEFDTDREIGEIVVTVARACERPPGASSVREGVEPARPRRFDEAGEA